MMGRRITAASETDGISSDAQPAAAASTRSTGAAAPSLPQQATSAAMTDDGAAGGASSTTSEAAAASLSSPSAATSLSGHKRSADARDSAASASAAATATDASDASSSLPRSQQQEDASDPSQRKKQRDGSSSLGSSLAAAASSAGFESLAAQSNAADALSTQSTRDDRESNASMEDSRVAIAADDERKEPHTASSSDDGLESGAAPSASAASSTTIGADLRDGEAMMRPVRSIVGDEEAPQPSSSPVPWEAAVAASSSAEPVRDSVALEVERLCISAQRLIQGVLMFTESEMHRGESARATQMRLKMDELADAEADLRSIAAMPGSEARVTVKQSQIADLHDWFRSEDGFVCNVFHVHKHARAAAYAAPSLNAIGELGALCSILLEMDDAVPPVSAQYLSAFAAWLRRVDVLFTRLRLVVQLSPPQVQDLLSVSLAAGALQLVPVLMRGWTDSEVPLRTVGEEPLLTYYCLNERKHTVCLEPYLHLFKFGLDPTLTEVGGNPLSALQLARNFVRDHPPPLPHPFDFSVEIQAAVAEDLAHDADAAHSVGSLLEAHAATHREQQFHEETQRRNTLHARFMHALIPAWRANSVKVLALLCARLFPSHPSLAPFAFAALHSSLSVSHRPGIVTRPHSLIGGLGSARSKQIRSSHHSLNLRDLGSASHQQVQPHPSHHDAADIIHRATQPVS